SGWREGRGKGRSQLIANTRQRERRQPARRTQHTPHLIPRGVSAMVLRLRPAALHAAVLLALCTPAAYAADHSPDVMRASRHDVSAPMRDIIRTLPPALPMGSSDEPFLVPNILLKPES